MAWLDALLAFAITMMVLSTIVSAIVEAGHSLLNQRAKGLERLMEHMFDKVIAPRLAGQIPADLTGSHFVRQMTDKRWVPIETNAPEWKRRFNRFLNKWRKLDKAEKLTTLEFIERLAESSVATAVLERSRNRGDNDENHNVLGGFLEDMASKFEDYGDSASSYFARRARTFSVLIGFVIVFSINFSAVDVFKTLIQSEAAREALIEQGEQIAESLNDQIASTESARQQGVTISAQLEVRSAISDIDVALKTLGDSSRASMPDAEFSAEIATVLGKTLERLDRTGVFLAGNASAPLVADEQTAVKGLLVQWQTSAGSNVSAAQLRTLGIARIQAARDRLGGLQSELEKSLDAAEFDQEKVARSVREGIRTLQKAQLPIGWQHAPWFSEAPAPLATTDDSAQAGVQALSSWNRFSDWFNWTGFLRWAASVFLAGLLVGLGGPFWFDTYRKLAALSSIAKSFQSQVKQENQEQRSQDEPEVKRTDRFVEIFETARNAADFAKAAGRQPLTHDGNTIQMGHIR